MKKNHLNTQITDILSSHSKTDPQCLEDNSRKQKKLKLSNEEIGLGIHRGSGNNTCESYETESAFLHRANQNSLRPVALQEIILQSLFCLLTEKCASFCFY